MSLLALAATPAGQALVAGGVRAILGAAIKTSAAPISGPLVLGASLRGPVLATPPPAEAAPPAFIGPSSGLGSANLRGAPMSLLGNGFSLFGNGASNGGGGFMSTSDFSNLAQAGIGLISALRSNRATSTSASTAVLPGAGRTLIPTGPSGLPPFPGPMGTVQRGAEAVGTAIARRFRRRRRLNPLNVRAARRAIRRIKAVRKITAQIERALPTRRVAARSFGSPGIITRREASRALRR